MKLHADDLKIYIQCSYDLDDQADLISAAADGIHYWGVNNSQCPTSASSHALRGLKLELVE